MSLNLDIIAANEGNAQGKNGTTGTLDIHHS